MKLIIAQFAAPKGAGVETTTIFEPDAGSNVMDVVINEKDKLTRIHFRNVGNANQLAAIQFSMSEYNRGTNRTKHFSFSIPQALAEIFITHLNTVK